jgi:hypothetical protein
MLPPSAVLVALSSGQHGVEESRAYRLVAKAGGGAAEALVEARRVGRRLRVEIVSVKPARMEPVVRMLTELMSRSRSPWLYRGPRWEGRSTREVLQAGPVRVLVEARYGPGGWLVEARVKGPGVEARMESIEGREEGP